MFSSELPGKFKTHHIDVLAGFSSLYIQDEDGKEHRERFYFNPQCPCSFIATTGITHSDVVPLPLWEELALFKRANLVKMDIKWGQVFIAPTALPSEEPVCRVGHNLPMLRWLLMRLYYRLGDLEKRWGIAYLMKRKKRVIQGAEFGYSSIV